MPPPHPLGGSSQSQGPRQQEQPSAPAGGIIEPGKQLTQFAVPPDQYLCRSWPISIRPLCANPDCPGIGAAAEADRPFPSDGTVKLPEAAPERRTAQCMGMEPCIPMAMARPMTMTTMPRITATQPSIKPASARPAPCSPVRLIWLRAM